MGLRISQTIAAGIVALALAACMAVPPAPQTRREAVLTAEYEYDAVLRSASDLRREGLVDDVLYGQLSAIFQRGSTALNLAHLAVASKDDAALNEQLAAVRDLILEARQLLQERADPHE